MYFISLRQVGGFQGRTCKEPDSCYSFWVGACIVMLGGREYMDFSSTAEFLLGHCQFFRGICCGGFAKVPGAPPDILHAFYSLCWLSLAGDSDLRVLNPSLGICSDRWLR